MVSDRGSQNLHKLLAKLPKSPGVYFFYDGHGQLMYIGKAVSLFDRVNSYFKQSALVQARPIEALIGQVKDLRWQTTDSAIEALILESNLISRFQPKYNIEAKDDKTFLGIYITDEAYPRVLAARLTHQKLPKGQFFGPYASAQRVRQALKIIRRIFPYCHEKVKVGRSCLYYHLKLCPGPCAGLISQKDYGQIIKNIKLFLQGQKKSLIWGIKKHLQQAVKAQNFEQAGRLKHQLDALQHIHDVVLQLTDQPELLTRQSPGRFQIEGYDIASISGQWAVGSMVVFIDGQAVTGLYRKFRIKTVTGINDIAMMQEVINRRLSHSLPDPHLPNTGDSWPLPDLILLDGGQGHYRLVRQLLDQYKVSIDLIAIAKGKSRQAARLFGQPTVVQKYRPLSPVLIQVRDEAHRFANQYHRALRSKNLTAPR